MTFGSFNNFLKISDNVVKVWSKILQNINNSKLILKSYNSYNTQTVLDKFKRYGVENSIIIYDRSNYSNVEDHLNLYENIDIAFDTFPYNGVTTTFEALWKGVPVLVLKGYNFNSRCGESIIKNANLEFLLSSNEDEYIEKAVYLSKNIEKLENERKKIYNKILNTPLFDSKKFSSNLKDELLKIYKKNTN
jgi:predicted O-linked N-acetylglucosamine transferase (SPINDLY family)